MNDDEMFHMTKLLLFTCRRLRDSRCHWWCTLCSCCVWGG